MGEEHASMVDVRPETSVAGSLLTAFEPYLRGGLLYRAVEIALDDEGFQADGAAQLSVLHVLAPSLSEELEEDDPLLLRAAERVEFLESEVGLDASSAVANTRERAWVDVSRATELVAPLPHADRTRQLGRFLDVLELGTVRVVRGGRSGGAVSHGQALSELGLVLPAAPGRPAVHLGFAADNGVEIKKKQTLVRDRLYFFWLQIGGEAANSITEHRVDLPTDLLPGEAVLSVALFGFDGELELDAGADRAELYLHEGDVTVRSAPKVPTYVGVDVQENRVFFRVRTAHGGRRQRLRCNIYCQGVLVQSHLVDTRVTVKPESRKTWGLRSRLEYALSARLDPLQLQELRPHSLSLMFNKQDEDIGNLRLFGPGGFKSDASINVETLQTSIEDARATLRMVSWGKPDEWQGEKKTPFRYQSGVSDEAFRNDLVRLAVHGWRIYDGLINGLAGDADQAVKLFKQTLVPGFVQIVLDEASVVVPAALFYDYVIDDTENDFSRYSLCERFSAAIAKGEPLETIECFNGHCPRLALDDAHGDHVVCPSGFWGFRLFLGFPLSESTDAATVITRNGGPNAVVGVSRDLLSFTNHERTLKTLFRTWETADSKATILKLLSERDPQVVYFFCHGFSQDNRVQLEFGPEGNREVFTSGLLRRRVRWNSPRPLVIINGCETTAVQPSQMVNFASSFIETANAAGVIGTDITNYESLATDFAQECLDAFLTRGASIGEAVRAARLKLLQDRNPLGLIYQPFVQAGLVLK